MTKQALQQALEALELAVMNGEHGLYRDELRQMQEAIEALRSALAQQGEQPVQTPLFDCDIQPRPLEYTLRDYHLAPSEGPLNYTWQDKPHRLLYDLIAAVKYYAAAPAAQPDARNVIGELLYCVEAWERGCLHEDYWRDRDDAIQAGKKWLEENK